MRRSAMRRSAIGLRAVFVVATAGTVSAWGCAFLPLLGQQPPGTSGKAGPASRADQVKSVRETIQSLQDTVKSVSQQYTSQATNTTKAASAFSGSGSGSGSVSKYKAQGRFQYGNGGKLEWDDTTMQLTRAFDGSTDIQFTFAGKDQEDRSLTATLSKSPDGTTGFVRAFLGSEGWSPYSFYGMPLAQPAPAYPGYYSTPAPTPPPYQFFYNEMPDIYSMKKVEVSVGVSPQGNASKAYELTVGADEFKTATFKLRQRLANLAPRPTSCYQANDGQGKYTTVCSSPAPNMPLPPFNAPNRVYVRAKVEKVKWDESIRWQEAGNDAMDFLVTGSITFRTHDAGDQTWHNDVTYHFTPVSEDIRVTFTFENPDKQVRLKGTLKPKKDSRGWLGTEMTGDVFSTQNDEKIGTLSYDSTKGDQYPVIEFTDGSPRMDLKFEGLPGFPTSSGPVAYSPTPPPAKYPDPTPKAVPSNYYWSTPHPTPTSNSGSGLIGNNGGA